MNRLANIILKDAKDKLFDYDKTKMYCIKL